MHVCLIGPTYPLRGGVAHYTTLLAHHLSRRGHRVSLLRFAAGYPRLLYPGGSDRDPSACPLRAAAWDAVSPWQPWRWPRAARRIAALHPDAALIEWWVPYWAPLQITRARRLRLAGVPVFFDCQNVLPHETGPLTRWATAVTLRRAAACMVYSAAHRAELLALAPGMRQVVVPFPPFDLLAQSAPLRESAREQLGVSGPVALFFGHVRPYKGLRVLLQALARAKTAVHLLVVGEFWEDPRVYAALIDRLGLQDRVTLINRYVPDEALGAYFAAADVVILPYRAPVQSGVLALAQAYRKPVIASRVGGLIEVLVEGQTGLLVPPENPAALAGAIDGFFTAALAAHMRPFLEAQVPDAAWDRVVAGWEQLLHER